ncbi:hypothetical protein BGZ60DRAFT_435416 [Tricladium varicosporioides]|nr:hypothetical protein BGZ60DRAFT_435416 [Hymenoscyphus varicosporioides]
MNKDQKILSIAIIYLAKSATSRPPNLKAILSIVQFQSPSTPANMAEAIALFGAVAAGVQCAQVGVQILILGSSLRSKLQDAPDQVQRWVGQIEQLVALAEIIKRSEVDLSPLSFQLQPPSSAASRTTGNWIKTALLECTSQAQTLRDILKDMLQEVDDGKRENLWKKLLTVKREQRIMSALQEIERQKSMLNMWLGMNNLHHLHRLRHTIAETHDGVGKVDSNLLHIDQTVHQGFQGLSTELNSVSKVTASGFDSLISLSASNTEVLTQEMQKYHGELRSENAVMQLQLHSIQQEMKSIKREFRRLEPFRARVSRAPSLLNEALQKHEETQVLCLNTNTNLKSRQKKRCDKITPKTCTCLTASQNRKWSFGLNPRATVVRRKTHEESCPIYTSTKSYPAAISWHVQRGVLGHLVKLSFQATHGAGGLSIGVSIRTCNQIQKHPLDSFFRDIYFCERRNRDMSRESSDNKKTRDYICTLIRRELIRTFDAGIASPDDVDCQGKTLLHLYNNPMFPTDFGYPYICDILLRKSKEDLTSFISRGMKPIEKTPRCMTPLHLAAAAHWPEAVKLLLASGADKHAQDSKLRLPIDIAIEANCLQSIDLLLGGNCELQFTTRRLYKVGNFPGHILYALFWTNNNIRETILQALIRLQNSLEVLESFHIFPDWAPEQDIIYVAEKILSAGFVDLELRDKIGNTALMNACLRGRLQDSALTAGFFLVKGKCLLDCKNIELEWPLHAVEQQVRAFVLGEIFNRLEMTHTCINLERPNHKIPEEDRLEIESEQDEYYCQLQALMEEYDLKRVEFSGGPLEYLDWFLEGKEFDLPHIPEAYHTRLSSPKYDLLGPGTSYQLCRKSFMGRDIYYGHKEPKTEENILSLLFD